MKSKHGFTLLNRSGGNLTGFTLIEIVLVIGILGVMAGVLMMVLNPFEQFKKANDAKRKNDLAQIQRAIESYYQDYGKYPDDTNETSTYRIVVSGNTVDWGTEWSPYIEVLPKDAAPGKKYIYRTSGDNQSYWLYAFLDRGAKDPQACNAGSACSNVPVNVYCGLSSSDICNYGVSSPNVSP